MSSSSTPNKIVKNDSKVGKLQKVQQIFQSRQAGIIIPVLAVLTVTAAITAIVILVVQTPEKIVLREKEYVKSENDQNQNQNQKPKPKKVEDSGKIAEKPEEVKPEVCQTPECINLAYQLHNWGDPSTNPCDDFHQYACGRYSEYSPDYSLLAHKDQTLTRLLTKLFVSETPTTSKTEEIMREFHKKCNEDSNAPISRHSTRDAYDKMQAATSFPILEKSTWQAAKFDLNKALTFMAQIGVQDFGLFWIEYVERANEKQVIIRPARDSSYDLSSYVVIDSFLKSCSITPYGTRTSMQQADTYRTKISAIKGTTGTELKTLKELANSIQSIDFLKNFHSILDVPELDTFVKVEPSALFFDPTQNLDVQLQNFSSDIEDLANFLFFQLFIQVIHPDVKLPLTEDCIQIVLQKMKRAALRHYTRNYFKKENRRVVSDMIDDIKIAYLEIIKNNTWMEDATRKAALLKMEKMRKMVGYGDEYEPEGTLDNMYKDFDKDGVLQKSYFLINNRLSEVHTTHKMQYYMSDWIFNDQGSIFAMNANYAPSYNRFNMLVPFMDDPLFDASFPDFAQFAGIGQVIGHEIGHGFDNHGRHYDEIGNQRDWWTAADSQKYDEKTKCFVDRIGTCRTINMRQRGDRRRVEKIGSFIINMRHRGDLHGKENVRRELLFVK